MRYDKTSAMREREKQILSLMIHIYCQKVHKSENALCSQCSELMEYAFARSDRCPFMESKTFCSNCKVHCYKPEMRERIRQVMRFSGSRMMLYYPITAVRHIIESKKEKSRLRMEKK